MDEPTPTRVDLSWDRFARAITNPSCPAYVAATAPCSISLSPATSKCSA
jgi:hypothetical protein